ncbi:hypothetical protein KBX50_29460 [Micromonospora sp. C51]|uniref:hypothetical protein n=1 Tax=Micromonospora sp. C51 TaxID=2824879 RepID=UPI001B3593CA|nr:hypothetical protein [Micromonospora sp. C51]MBQ1052566.1 hypothetical protein [Micromonospora sp. C51]
MQLREVVDVVTADEPPLSHSTEEIIRAGRKAERRRRAGFASAGAAGLVAVVVAGVSALPLVTSGQASEVAPGTGESIAAPAAPNVLAEWPDAPPFSFTFTAFDAGKLRVQDPIVASTAYQIARVYVDGMVTNDRAVTDLEVERYSEKRKTAEGASEKRVSAYLTLYRPGAFDPSGTEGGTSSTVAGRDTVQWTFTSPAGRQLAWEYADDAWAVVTAYTHEATPTFEELSALATAMKPSPPETATLPFTVGHVPSGYTPVELGTRATSGVNGVAEARDGNYGGAVYTKPALATTGLAAPWGSDGANIPGSFTIFVTPSTNSNQQAEAGRTRCLQNDSTFCNVWSADGKVQVQVSSEHLSVAETTRIAESVTLADVQDQDTWIPAAEALVP